MIYVEALTPQQCRGHLSSGTCPTFFQFIYVRRVSVSETRFERKIHGGGVRLIGLLSLSAAIINQTIDFESNQSTIVIFCTFLALGLELSNSVLLLPSCRRDARWTSRQSVQTLNRDTYPLTFRSGDETWLAHRAHIPNQRRLRDEMR